MKIRIIEKANGMYATQTKIGLFASWHDRYACVDDLVGQPFHYAYEYPLQVAKNIFNRIRNKEQEERKQEAGRKIIAVVWYQKI